MLDRTENRKSRWFPTVIPKSIDFFKATKRKVNDFHPFPRNPSTFSRPKKSKSMISSCFPEIHRLSQNRQNAKSMIFIYFPKIHRLSQNWQNAKSMVFIYFPKIHRLSQNRQTAKSMIFIYYPKIHRLSAQKGLGTGAICRPKGRSAPLACCLAHAGGWKCGQGQATRRVVACREASEPLEGTASRWHPRPEQSGGHKYARQLTGARRCPVARADITSLTQV